MRYCLVLCLFVISLYSSSVTTSLAQVTKNKSISGGFDQEVPVATSSARKREIRILFVTNRNVDLGAEIRARNSGALLKYENVFLNTPSVAINYGWVLVSYPSHRKRGDDVHGVNSALQNPLYHFSVVDHLIISSTAVFRRTMQQLYGAVEHPSLMFVHGLDNSFSDGAQRLAQLSVDLVQPGIPVLFSWPADAVRLFPLVSFVGLTPTSYGTARDLSQASRQYLAHAMEEVVEGSKKPFNLIAHSMGTDLTAHAIPLVKQPTSIALGVPRTLALAAPDLSVKDFDTLLPHLTASNRRLMVYCSDDRSLTFSTRINNGEPRLGSCRSPPQARPGVDTIMVKGAISDFMRHSYYLNAAKILDDMERAILEHDRYGLSDVIKSHGRTREVGLP